MTAQKTEIRQADLAAAEEGSWYTIFGCGGDLQEWVDGYEDLLAKKEIGKPAAWYRTTGNDVNWHVGQQVFASDTVILMFPLDGLNVGRLAMFKMQMADRWFDDVVRNAR